MSAACEDQIWYVDGSRAIEGCYSSLEALSLLSSGIGRFRGTIEYSRDLGGLMRCA